MDIASALASLLPPVLLMIIVSLVNWFQVKPHKSLTSAKIIWFWKDLRRALVIR